MKNAIEKFRQVIFLSGQENTLHTSSYLALSEIYSKLGKSKKSINCIDRVIRNYKKYGYPAHFLDQAEKLKKDYLAAN